MRRQPFQRFQRALRSGLRILIACEDSKTAPGYFEAIRKELRLPTGRITVISPPATDPLNIVKATVARRDAEKSAQAWSEGDQAWAVFDGDEHIQDSAQNWNEALQLANGKNIHLAVSNPSFELWYLLHYQDQFAALHRDHALQTLKKHLNNYVKSDILYPDPLKPFTPHAIRRAQEMAKRAQQNDLPEHANPCAERVAVLVQRLLTFTG